ncbi:PLP-dependent aminotransferase family protein [Aliiroseovarius crassostreae]|uniref:MocR-like pyridoxine biosynthesis transcription factor PdxR n=1 Tax=Aliiroseovarius crassostreae TaxID=154981 RepID=UPI003C7E1BFA
MQNTSWLAFSIDRTSTSPVFEQICEAIRARTVAGDLTEGQKLPPTRVFATELGVSRSTVVTAYEQLVAEGYLVAQQGSGYRVCAVGEVELPRRAERPRQQNTPLNTAKNTPQNTAPAPRPFEAGQPDMRLFPHRQWAKTVARICRSDPQSMLMGAPRFGHLPLRQAIADHVAEWRGIQADPDQIILTAGATDALEICTRTLARPGDGIGLEDPGYRPLRQFALARDLRPEYLPVVAGDVSLPRTTPRIVVLTPSQQYPLGGAMSPGRRREFIRWAEREDAWIIEDDYDSEFRYAGRPIPAMAGFDHLSRTIYVGSFSKIFSNTLRLGYLIMPRALTDQFHATLRRFGPRASLMPQAPLAAFLSSGEFYRHLRRVRRIYGERRRFLTQHLAREFAEFGWFHDHQAGMQICFHLQGELRDTEIARRAADQKLTISPLSHYAQDGSGVNGLILGFCATSEDEMAPALQRLTSLLRSYSADAPS